jgi:uncharacterized membrane protein YccC
MPPSALCTPNGNSAGKQGRLLKLDQIRPNVFTLRATSQELSALVAAARMALDLMRSDPRAPVETLELVTRVLHDYDRALARHEEADGRSSRPPADSSEDELPSR